MQSKFNTLTMLVKFSLCALLALGFVVQVQAQDKKADGTWSWTMQGRNGGADRKMTLKLKTEGDKLTGTLSAPNREGQMTDTAIEEGKVKGDEISFTVTRGSGDRKFTSKYTGKVGADAIKGKMEFERNGEKQSRDWEAKREAAK